ncbi:MAG: ABC-2 transporter permease [Lachnospiraceae bacterium]|nr:ABC-2 transporter permease [Lachnospiraceae bacterium]
MKGLIFKDIKCLKKQFMVFCYVLIGTLAVSVMYVLSVRFGNLADINAEMLAENQMEPESIKNMSSFALIMFMLLPLSCVGDSLNAYEQDGKAGFYKLASTFPIPLHKRILSRFLSVFAILGIGIIFDTAIAALLSCLTDIMTFSEFMGVIVSAASLLAIDSSLAIFYSNLLGYGKSTYVQLLSLITMIMGYVLIRFEKVKEVITNIVTTVVEDKDISIGRFWGFMDIIMHKAVILLALALAVMVVSYIITCIMAQRKRGVF